MAGLGVKVSAEPLGDAAAVAIAEGADASGDGLISAVHAAPESAISDTAAMPKSARRPRFEPVMSNPPPSPESSERGTSVFGVS
jgi:3-deoxy-D-arabino-heptulosonate 7-phosphate (DAHP) synthase